jgi:hypothetical protein
MVNKPKEIGTACETAVVRHLVAHGFPSAERPALHGALDEGDITGTPGVAWEVKGGHAAESASDAQIHAWMSETETERVNRRADVAVLVCKRKGKGAANAGSWWAFLPGWAYVHLAEAALAENEWFYTGAGRLPVVRLLLAEAVALLRAAGYGDPLPL